MNVRKREEDGRTGKKKRHDIPESLLDAANIVHVPVLLGDIFLANRNAGPRNTHLSNTVDIVLIEVDLLRAEVTLGPLSKTPLLDNLLGLIKGNELSSHVSVEDSELAADLGALKLARCTARECSDTLRVRKGGVELAGCGAELV